MNAALAKGLANPWLASVVSFLPVIAVLAIVFLLQPHPLPGADTVAAMPWWAVLGGLAGAFSVVLGLLVVKQIGDGPFVAFAVTANVLMALAVDHFGWFGVEPHGLTWLRAGGGALMALGLALIALG